MTLLLVFSGTAAKHLAATRVETADADVVKVDEKIVASPAKLLGLVRAKPYTQILVGCDDLDAHRFHLIQKFYILLTTRSGIIIDDCGRQDAFGTLTFLGVELPRLALEVLVSGAVVVFYYLRMPFLKWTLLRKTIKT
jgi:hypothetical protein